jgi:UDP-N-acetylglucosamine acyltransferase
MIHPTAQIHPDAQVGANVSVGAYAVIEGPAQIGDGCQIAAHAVLTGRVIMGRQNSIGHGAVIGGEPQDLGFKAETESCVRIGDRNRIREHCTIHRGTQPGSATVVGDDCFLMAGAHLGHNSQLGNRVILANNVLLGGHKDIPPFTVGAEVNCISGLNVIGLRRAGFTSEQRQEVKRAFALLYQSGLNTSQALAAAAVQKWGPEAQEFFDFVAAAKKRGICALLRTSAGAPEPD